MSLVKIEEGIKYFYDNIIKPQFQTTKNKFDEIDEKFKKIAEIDSKFASINNTDSND